jgi:hypothetical protein
MFVIQNSVMRIVLLSGLFVALGLLSICLLSNRPYVEKVSKVEVLEIVRDSVIVSINAIMTNDNFFSINGKNVSIKSLNNKESFPIGDIQNFRISSYSTDTIGFSIKFKISEVLRHINSNSPGQNWKLAITGDFMPLFFVKFIEFEIDVPKLLFQNLNLIIGDNSHNLIDSSRVIPQVTGEMELNDCDSNINYCLS